MERFPAFFPQLVPHLYAVNINGMKAGGPKILTVGQGDREVELLKIIRNSKYRGPIGIVNHIETQDAEIGLRSNMEGLKSVLRQMDDTQALATY